MTAPSASSVFTPRRPQDRHLTIGCLAPEIYGDWAELTWQGMMDAAHQHGVTLLTLHVGLLWDVHEPKEQANILCELVEPGRMDGLIFWEPQMRMYTSEEVLKNFYQRYAAMMPVVAMEAPVENCPYIPLDSYDGMCAAFAHLIEVHGYRRIGFVRAGGEHPGFATRYRAYCETLARYGIAWDEQLVAVWIDREENKREFDARWLGIVQAGAEAIGAPADFFAVQGMAALQEQGISIPDQVAIVSFDDVLEGKLCTPRLTTVRPQFYGWGRQAVESILTLIAGHEFTVPAAIPSTLVVRQSCGCPDPMVTRAALAADLIIRTQQEQPAPMARDALLAEMAAAIPSCQLRATWPRQLLEAFETELRDESRGVFLRILDPLLTETAANDGDLLVWQDVISILYQRRLPILTDRRQTIVAENLWHQARVKVGNMAQWKNEHRAAQIQQQTTTLNEIGSILVTTFNVPELMQALARELPKLGIRECYLSLYDDPQPYRYPQPAPAYARLMLAYNHQGRAALPDRGIRFPSVQLVPEQFLQHEHASNLLVMALYFVKQQIGFVVFDVGIRQGTIYHTLQRQISSALQGYRLMQSVQAHATDLETVNRELRDFAHVVSHDLKAPLRAIARLADWIVADYTDHLDDEGQEMLHLMVNQVRHLDKLIDGILQYSRIGRLEQSDSLVDANQVVHTIVGMLAVPANVTITVDNQLPMIMADLTRITQLFQNLLSNALKFLDKAQGQIHIGCTAKEDLLIFRVTDNGPGIAPQDHEKIFQLFQSLTPQDHGDSTGIGLAVVKKIVEQYGGKIWVESCPGEGSSFFFTLPRASEQAIALALGSS